MRNFVKLIACVTNNDHKLVMVILVDERGLTAVSSQAVEIQLRLKCLHAQRRAAVWGG
jgi:hypothetical protein